MDKGRKQPPSSSSSSSSSSSFQPEATKKHPRQSVPKVLSTGRSKPDFRCRQGAAHADLLSQELEELRHMSIGSPVPTPRAEYDLLGTEGSFGSCRPGSFPLIKVDSCEVGMAASGPSGDGVDEAEESSEVARRGKGARRNSDTLATPCYVPRSTGSKVVRYTFRGPEDAVSD